MNITVFAADNFTTSHRQGKFLGPLVGFLLATIFPNLAIAKLQPGSIKFEYDPVPLVPANYKPASINIYQTPKPMWEHNTDLPHEMDAPIETVPTSLESPPDYLAPKVTVKRAIPARFLPQFRRNPYVNIRRFWDYLDYENYDYLTGTRQRFDRRNQGRRPTLFDDYDYDYNFRKTTTKRPSFKRRYPTKPRKDPDFNKEAEEEEDDDDEFNDEIEPVTVPKPKQKPKPQPQKATTTTTTEPPTTTAMESTTMPSTTSIVNGTTPSTTNIGYGPYSSNENISITYGPPTALKPVYGVPGTAYGSPLNEWVPSYQFESPGTYHNSLHGSPGVSYPSREAPSYSLSASYGTPSIGSSSYQHSLGGPSSNYGPPSTSYGVPGQSYGTPSHGDTGGSAYQNYQLPFSSWYGKSTNQEELLSRAQDIVKYH